MAVILNVYLNKKQTPGLGKFSIGSVNRENLV
jgi:hypothetical protein